MSSMTDEARRLDQRGAYIEAIHAYEQAIATDDPSLDVYLDAIVLNWDATDPGNVGRLGLDREFIQAAEARYESLFDEALLIFPDAPDLRFWKAYIYCLSRGKPGLDATLGELAKLSDPGDAVFHLFARSDGDRFGAEAARLYEAAKQHLTARSRYIIGVIEGVRSRSV